MSYKIAALKHFQHKWDAKGAENDALFKNARGTFGALSSQAWQAQILTGWVHGRRICACSSWNTNGPEHPLEHLERASLTDRFAFNLFRKPGIPNPLEDLFMFSNSKIACEVSNLVLCPRVGTRETKFSNGKTSPHHLAMFSNNLLRGANDDNRVI